MIDLLTPLTDIASVLPEQMRDPVLVIFIMPVKHRCVGPETQSVRGPVDLKPFFSGYFFRTNSGAHLG
ncbi:MAG TPA: hypothetical protein P5061_09500, partial [Mycobacterium sp.]|nr:hypothetical protein [Mycobacterium sp.]